MSPDNLPRRIIAAAGPDGKSCVVTEESVPLSGKPQAIDLANMWTGRAMPVSNRATVPGGFAPFRFAQFSDPAYWMILVDYAPGLGAADPGMHFTDTVDHFCVLSGEVVLVLETGDVVLKAGDVCICRGAMHGWRNDSSEVCRLISFVLPAEPLAR